MNRNWTAKPSDQNHRIVDDDDDVDDENAFLTISLNTPFFAWCKFSSPNIFFSFVAVQTTTEKKKFQSKKAFSFLL